MASSLDKVHIARREGEREQCHSQELDHEFQACWHHLFSSCIDICNVVSAPPPMHACMYVLTRQNCFPLALASLPHTERPLNTRNKLTGSLSIDFDSASASC